VLSCATYPPGSTGVLVEIEAGDASLLGASSPAFSVSANVHPERPVRYNVRRFRQHRVIGKKRTEPLET
jgi:hypothetical protein